jgi:hypothetical protein
LANRAIHELFADLAHWQVAGLKNKLTFLGVILDAVKLPFQPHSSAGIPSLPKRRLGAKLDQFAASLRRLTVFSTIEFLQRR